MSVSADATMIWQWLVKDEESQGNKLSQKNKHFLPAPMAAISPQTIPASDSIFFPSFHFQPAFDHI